MADVHAAAGLHFGGGMHHIGVVTNDQETLVHRLLTMGGTLVPMKPRLQSFLEEEYLGKPFSASDAMSQVKVNLGGLEIEVFLPNGKPSTWQACLDAKGPGIHHVGFLAEDVASEARKQIAVGAHLIGHVSVNGVMRACYLQLKDLPFAIEFLRVAQAEPAPMMPMR